MKFILDNIELILSGAGLIVIWLVPSFVIYGRYDIWRVTALTAITVGLLHGLIFWLIRRRQRQVREEAIEEMRLMLRDIINNQLTIIMASASQSEAKNVERVTRSIQRISELLDTLSEESLRAWKSRYARTLKPRS